MGDRLPSDRRNYDRIPPQHDDCECESCLRKAELPLFDLENLTSKLERSRREVQRSCFDLENLTSDLGQTPQKVKRALVL